MRNQAAIVTPPTVLRDSKFARFTNTSGEYISTPDSTALDITGAIEIVVRLNPPQWTAPSGLRALVGKWGPTNFSYAFFLNTSGQLQFWWTSNGTTGVNHSSSSNIAFGTSISGWVKAEFIPNNGSGRSCAFYYAADAGDDIEPTSWTQLGTTQTSASPTTIYSGSQALQVGSTSSGVDQRWVGHISRVILRNGIGGTVVADFRAKDYTSGTSWVSSTTGETWTINGAGVKVTPLWRLIFEGDSLTSGTGSTANNDYPTQLVGTLMTGARYHFNYALAGDELTAMAANFDSVVGPALAGWPYAVAVIWGGTNDMYFGADASTSYERYRALCKRAKALRARVVVATVLPRSGAGVPGDFETERQTFNTLLRAGYAEFADALADIAANTTIGDSGDELNTTYYSADKVHLTNAGYTIVAGIVKDALATIGVT